MTGICGSGIIEAIAELHLAGVLTTDGTIDGAFAARTPRVVPNGRCFSYVLHEDETQLLVTQDDVRQIQLAKGALYAGCRLLMDHYGLERVDRIRLAGAFGSQIDPVHALVLGLIPDCDPERVTAAGNAAGTGARIALLNVAARREIEDVVRRVEKVETAVEPRFQEHFVSAMAIPHDLDPYERLGAVVASLPRGKPHLRARKAERDAEQRREGAANEHAHGATRRRSCRPAGGAHARSRREGSLHHADHGSRRGPLGRGPRADRVERGHAPRAGRHRLPRGPRRL